jgi:hypothetical protein
VRGLPVGGWIGLKQKHFGRRIDKEDEAALLSAWANQGPSVCLDGWLAEVRSSFGAVERQGMGDDLVPREHLSPKPSLGVQVLRVQFFQIVGVQRLFENVVPFRLGLALRDFVIASPQREDQIVFVGDIPTR